MNLLNHAGFFDKFITLIISPTPNPNQNEGLLQDFINKGKTGTSGKTEFVGGWVGEAGDSFVENFKKGFTEIIDWIVKGFFGVSSPFFDWGCRAVIVACVIIFYCTQDKKSISTALKTFFIYIIFLILRGAAG